MEKKNLPFLCILREWVRLRKKNKRYMCAHMSINMVANEREIVFRKIMFGHKSGILKCGNHCY